MSQATVPALVMRRTFDAAPQRVFDAWTTRETLAQFLLPGTDVTIKDVQLDARLGGAYSVVFGMPDGEDWTVTGTYKDVSPPHRLSMTWRWVEDDPKDERDTVLTLEFHPRGTGTELILTHENLRNEEALTNHAGGWKRVLDRLPATL